ncbi:MAG: hypothetical protein H7Z75_10960 [Ferruginibacter sp.]|nr:hypothetical protein [Cytophagales bacterium]
MTKMTRLRIPGLAVSGLLLVSMHCFTETTAQTKSVDAGTAVRTAEATRKAATNPAVAKQYQGTIGNKLAIRVSLTIQQNSLAGEYAYVSVGKKLVLGGKMRTPDGEAEFAESDEKGRETGSFVGFFSNQFNQFEGLWRDPRRRKNLPVFIQTAENGAYAAKAAPTPDDRARIINWEVKPPPGTEAGSEPVTVNFPYLVGLKNRDVQARAQQVLNETYSPQEFLSSFRDRAAPDEFGYEVTLNRKAILQLVYDITSTGAYTSRNAIRVSIDLKTGEKITHQQLFLPAKEAALRQLLNGRLEAEKKELLAENQTDPERDAESKQAFEEMLAEAQFHDYDLENFIVGDDQLTFVYSYPFPHAMQALAPDPASLPLLFRELQPFVNPRGPLGRLIE